MAKLLFDTNCEAYFYFGIYTEEDFLQFETIQYFISERLQKIWPISNISDRLLFLIKLYNTKVDPNYKINYNDKYLKTLVKMSVKYKKFINCFIIGMKKTLKIII